MHTTTLQKKKHDKELKVLTLLNSPNLELIEHLWEVLDKQIWSKNTTYRTQDTGHNIQESAANLMVPNTTDMTAPLQRSCGVYALMCLSCCCIGGLYIKYFVCVCVCISDLPENNVMNYLYMHTTNCSCTVPVSEHRCYMRWCTRASSMTVTH